MVKKQFEKARYTLTIYHGTWKHALEEYAMGMLTASPRRSRIAHLQEALDLMNMIPGQLGEPGVLEVDVQERESAVAHIQEQLASLGTVKQ